MKKDSRLHLLVLAILYGLPLALVSLLLLEVSVFFIFPAVVLLMYVLLGNLRYISLTSLRRLYVGASMIKLVLLLAMVYVKPGFLSGVDWANFHRYTLQALESGQSLISLYQSSLDLFVFFMALVYKIFGNYPDQIYFIIFICSLLLFRYTYKTVILLGGSERIASIAGLVVLLWPVNIVYSATLVREIPIQLVVSISFYFFVRYLKQNTRVDFTRAGLFAVIAALMHSGMVALLAVYFYIFAQGKASTPKRMLSIKALFVASVVMLGIVVSPLGGGLVSRFSGLGDIDSVNRQYEFQLEASTTYISATAGSLGEFFLSAPYRFFMFTLAPLPWQVTSMETALAWIMDGALQIFIVGLLIKAWRASRFSSVYIRNVIIAGLLCVISLYAVLAMGTNNYGSAMRHRTKAFPIIVVVIAASAIARREQKTLRS